MQCVFFILQVFTPSKYIRYFCCIVLLSTSSILSAQINDDDFKSITISIEGEEVFHINAIVQGEQGYIWMNTNLGLIKYDGYEPKVYKNILNDTTQFQINPYNNITELFAGFKGDLWIGTKSGLSRYKPDCDCFFKYSTISGKTIPTGFITAIIEDQNKHIWFAVKNQGLFRYERENDDFIQFLNNPLDSINLVNDEHHVLLADQNNNIWIGTKTGLIHFDLKTGKTKKFTHHSNNKRSLLDNHISALHEDSQGRILIGTLKSGLHIFNQKSEDFDRMEYDPSNPNQLHAPYSEDKIIGMDPFVHFIHQDQKGGYWISTYGKGINYFNLKTKKSTFYSYNPEEQEEFSLNTISSFLEDNQGNLWFGSFTNGLLKKDLFAQKFTLHHEFGSVMPPYESPINQGTLWIPSMGEGLGKLDLKTNQITKLQHNKDDVQSIGHTWARHVYQENSNVLWVGLGYGGGSFNDEVGDGGLDRMDIKTETFTHYKIKRDDTTDDFSETVYSISEDKEGRLWLGTGPGGLFRSDKEKKEFKQFNFPRADSISINPVIYVPQIYSNGTIWASDARYGGLYKYDSDADKFRLFLKGFFVLNMLEDKNGWFWISTLKKGILHLNPTDGSYKQYSKKDGLHRNFGTFILEGNEEGVYWIGSRYGPSKMDTRTGKITAINIPIARYNLGGFKSADGKLFFPANKGLLSFYPNEIMGNPFLPNTVISDFLISGMPYKSDINHSNEITLHYNQNDISFKYVGLHFSNSSKNQYQYKLTPVNDDWIHAGKERIARYANLPSGTYTFQVKSANSDGVWNEEAAFVQFTIKPAWWATWWAYIIYFAIAIALADRFYRFQLSKKLAIAESNRLKEVNHLKNSLYTNITHEFRTPLTVILGMADSLKSNVANKQLDQAEESLEMIERNGKNLLRLVNEMLDLSKLESGNMELQLIQADVIPFVKYLSESFNSLAQEKKINLTVYSEVDELVMDFDPEKMTSIMSNILSNAIKFTSNNGKVIVHLKKILKSEKAIFYIKIKDNGLGISKKEIVNIFDRFYQVNNTSSRKNEGTGIGLALTKELVDLMKGQITVKSTPGKGSEFVIQLPIANNANQTRNLESQIEPDLIRSENIIENDPKIPQEKSELPLALIIEDNKDVAHYLKTCLTGKYQTMHASNGKLGIETAFEKVPDIIICDVMMPVKDGFEACAELKSDERTDHIPIIMLTAKASMKDRLTGLSSGADAYLTKPFVKAELFTRLDQLILLRKRMMQKIENDSFSKVLTIKAENPETKFLQKIIKIIHEEISNHSFGSSVHISHKMHLSESQIYRKLKAITGKSTAVFIRSVRLQYAKELIQTTNKTISEIAYDVGFNDPSWFSRAFKEEFGFSPSAISK